MPDIGVPQGPPMGDSPAPDPGAGGTPPSGDSTPVLPPQGTPMTPQSVPAVGALAIGRMHMGVALLHMDQAIRTLPAGTEDHSLAMKMYQMGLKHFKKQEPITPNPGQMQRPGLPAPPPGMPGMGGAGAPGASPMGLPMPPRGPIPAPMAAGGP